MQILANWNDQQMPLAEVRVSVLDRSFMFGDAIYEVVRIYNGRAWRLSDHIERLGHGLSDLQIPFDTSVIEPRLSKVIEASGAKEALGYMQVTRGAAPRHHYFPKDCSPNCLIYVEPFADPFAPMRVAGASAITFPDIRWMRNDIKATALLANCLAANAAVESGCIESLLVKNGVISEGSHTSVFGVRDGKLIVSPSSAAVLPGITKKQIIELCTRAGIAMSEGYLQVDELGSLEELFITATPEEVIGITQVDDRRIADGKVGPVTLRLHQEFRKTVEQWLQAGVR
jgi:D-alanine transaminase